MPAIEMPNDPPHPGMHFWSAASFVLLVAVIFGVALYLANGKRIRQLISKGRIPLHPLRNPSQVVTFLFVLRYSARRMRAWSTLGSPRVRPGREEQETAARGLGISKPEMIESAVIPDHMSEDREAMVLRAKGLFQKLKKQATILSPPALTPGNTKSYSYASEGGTVKLSVKLTRLKKAEGALLPSEGENEGYCVACVVIANDEIEKMTRSQIPAIVAELYAVALQLPQQSDSFLNCFALPQEQSGLPEEEARKIFSDLKDSLRR